VTALFGAVDLPVPEDAPPLGFRLQRLEILNWGTFDQRVWTIELSGNNGLLTGDIGSGKSTLVDAVTTLLLPAQKISYNKAAGASTRERDLRSYVQGHYKSERSETTGSSRPVGLRTTGTTYSVLLGVFGNAGYDATVSLAQVFWSRNSTAGQPERFFVVADRDFSITGDLADFGSDMAGLRKKLRASGARIHDAFPNYGTDYRRALGIESAQAMDLFHQTVSMKSVSDLNGFVRGHMLEPFDAAGWIARLVGHFEDLTRAHDAVLTARRQVEQLTPLLADASTWDQLDDQLRSLESQRTALRPFVADHKAALLDVDLARCRAEIESAESRVADLDRRAGQLDERRSELRLERAGLGGDRLGELERSIARLREDHDRCRERRIRFEGLLAGVGLPAPGASHQFASCTARIAAAAGELAEQEAGAQNALTDLDVQDRSLDADAKEINAELRSLAERRSSIPRTSLALRDRLCTDLRIDVEDLAFAGELIQVRPEASEWEAAAERVLHGFGLSLLVPDRQYAAVAGWIDTHHLGTRLVYYRIPGRITAVPVAPDAREVVERLVEKLQIQQESPFYPWLERELRQRAGLLCARTMEEFRRADRAVTRAGQIKSTLRHEKNDIRPIGDRSGYVLGWDNQSKIDALLERASGVNTRRQHLATELQRARGALAAINQRRSSFARLEDYRSWTDLDWESLTHRIAELDREREALESSSGELARIVADLNAAERELAAVTSDHRAAVEHLGGRRATSTSLEELLSGCHEVIGRDPVHDAAITQALDRRAAEADLRTPAAYDTWERATGEALLRELDRHRTRQERLGTRMVTQMNAFLAAYPVHTAEIDSSLAAIGEYRTLHDRLVSDDLPRFEREFKMFLNTNAIRDIAGFQAELNRQVSLIRDRIDRINESLVGIDYNEGRYIRLEAERTPNVEVTDFRAELRSCTDDAVSGGDDEQYSERKFLQVKAIIERFRGRVGHTDTDRVWTRWVTDVRNWFVFVASERRRDDDAEHESYTDSGGKSGGQKEKLAYTVLAASLAYQFKLDWGVERSRTFRFVVIDEAFGRGSDESTRFALSLFRRLDLQLMIVTPLQKIHVIEPFVNAVGFVDNPTGSYSRLQTLTIEELRSQQLQQLRRRAATEMIEMAG
jgi:uncharacterized protein YPO0396